MIGQNRFIAIVRIHNFANYSTNHFELIDIDSVNAKLSLVENCNLVDAKPIEDYVYYTVSNSVLTKIPVTFIAENKQFIIYIDTVLASHYRNYELYNEVDKYLTYRMGQFWITSKTNTFKNINYPGYNYDLLSFAHENPTSPTA